MNIIICKHGNKGFSASLRFDDGVGDIDISSTNKYSLYKTIEYIVHKRQVVNNESK